MQRDGGAVHRRPDERFGSGLISEIPDEGVGARPSGTGDHGVQPVLKPDIYRKLAVIDLECRAVLTGVKEPLGSFARLQRAANRLIRKPHFGIALEQNNRLCCNGHGKSEKERGG